jgi:CheY-like chemotaxis protein
MRHPARLLIVEDERVIALDLQRWVTRLGYTVVALTATGPEAIHQALEHRPDLVLMDIHLQGERDGVEAVMKLSSTMNTIPRHPRRTSASNSASSCSGLFVRGTRP